MKNAGRPWRWLPQHDHKATRRSIVFADQKHNPGHEHLARRNISGIFRVNACLLIRTTRRGCEPASRRAVDERRQRLAHADVIVVEPLDLLRIHQLPVDETQVDRRKRNGFKSQHFPVGFGDRPWLDDQQIFDPDAELARPGNSRVRSKGSFPERAASPLSSRFGAAPRERKDRSRRHAPCHGRNPIRSARAEAAPSASICAPLVPFGNKARAMAM